MTPALLLSAVVGGDVTHVRRYSDRRAWWACSAVGWAPCPGHGPPPATPATGHHEASDRPCIHGHPAERVYVRFDKHGHRSRHCRECNLARYHDGRSA